MNLVPWFVLGLVLGAVLYYRRSPVRVSVAAVKREAYRARREAEAPARSKARFERKARRACFWTWPWGHLYEKTQGDILAYWACKVCGKRDPGGDW